MLLTLLLGTEAGDAYVKAAETEIKSGEVDASVMKFVNAASCYKKSEPKSTNWNGKVLLICVTFRGG